MPVGCTALDVDIASQIPESQGVQVAWRAGFSRRS